MSNVKIKVGFVTPGYAAWVPKSNLIVVADEKHATNRRLIAHELQHVKQHRKYGLFFYLAYAIGWAKAGFSYWDNWMEREAREAEQEPRMLMWADRVIKESGFADEQ